jgi:hypothetical protein
MMTPRQVRRLQNIGDSISEDIRGCADGTSFKARIFAVTFHLKFRACLARSESLRLTGSCPKKCKTS